MVAPTISHFSLDLWNTLITPNKQYSIARNQYLSQVIGAGVSWTGHAYAQFKKKIDHPYHRSANAMSVSQCIEALFAYVRILDGGPGIQADVEAAKAVLQELFERYPPHFNHELGDALRSAGDHGISLNITSNINFIGGATLRRVLMDNWDVPFEFILFSDETGVAKPDPRMFQLVKENIKVPVHEVVHIGDDVHCDWLGAHNCGFRSMLVTGPDVTLQLIQKLINQGQH